jgi:hypothetical protein
LLQRLKFVLPVGAAIFGLLPNQVGAFAYTSATYGYDLSFPQCGPPVFIPPSLASPSQSWKFGLIGVDGGWPFISSVHPGNPCLGQEYQGTVGPALYINTGYATVHTDSNHTTAQCASLSSSINGNNSQRKAWAVGCSEASKSMAYAASQGATYPAAWWLDVETANSWSNNTALNQYTLQGLVDTLHKNSPLSVPVGIYSTASQWASLVGSKKVTGVAADWVATAVSVQQAPGYCSASFTGDPVWLVQYSAQYQGTSFDGDYAC